MKISSGLKYTEFMEITLRIYLNWHRLVPLVVSLKDSVLSKRNLETALKLNLLMMNRDFIELDEATQAFIAKKQGAIH